MSSVILITVTLIFCYAVAWHDRSAASAAVIVKKNSRLSDKARETGVHV